MAEDTLKTLQSTALEGDGLPIKNLEFVSNHIRVNYDHGDGSVSSKIVSLPDFCSLLASSARSRSIVVPKGCRYIVENRKKMYLLFVTPAHIGQAICRWGESETQQYGAFKDLPTIPGVSTSEGRTRVFTIPYPATAMIAKVTHVQGPPEQFTLDTLFCYTLKSDKFPIDQMMLSRWPFTNVFNDCRVCIGSRALTKYPTMESMAGLPALVYQGINNHDIDSGVMRESGKLRFGKIHHGFDFVVKLHGETEFPYEYLMDLNISAKEAVDALVRQGK